MLMELGTQDEGVIEDWDCYLEEERNLCMNIQVVRVELQTTNPNHLYSDLDKHQSGYVFFLTTLTYEPKQNHMWSTIGMVADRIIR